MFIITKLKLDLKQQPYWSSKLVNDSDNNNVMLEVNSQTFDINHDYNKWKQYEMAQIRMAKEIMARTKDPAERYAIAQMFLNESEYDKTENRN